MRKLSAIPFRASYDGVNLFEALTRLKPGLGEFSALRAWEMELMLSLQTTEEQYSLIPLKERARMVAGMKRKEWMQALESDRAVKEMKSRG